MAFLFVDLPAGEVDVNVHPTKREVRFRAEPTVRNLLMSGLTERLAGESRQVLRKAEAVPPAQTEAPRQKPAPEPVLSPPRAAPRREFPQAVERPVPEPAPKPTPAPGVWRFCGIWRKQVGLFESPDGLVLLNARAARERILFERIENSLAGEAVPRQPLLIPHMLELQPLDASVLSDQLDFFKGIGFEIEPFGRHLYRIRSVPAWMQGEHAEDFVSDLVNRIRQRGLRPEDAQPARTLVAKMAAMREARGFTVEDEAAWQALAKALLACENPLLDGRGRPTFVEIRQGEIARKLMLEGGGPESDGLEGRR